MRLCRATLLTAALLLHPLTAPTAAGAAEISPRPLENHPPTSTLQPAYCSLGTWSAQPELFPRAVVASPALACLTLLEAYQALDLATYGSLLTDDFRFVPGDSDLRRQSPDGWTRQEELASADHLFHGVVRPSGQRLPAARAIRFELDSIWVEPGPEHHASAGDCMLVEVGGLSMSVEFVDGSRMQTPAEHHEFQMVRRPFAQGDASRGPVWQVRRWVEGDPISPATPSVRPGIAARAASESRTRIELAFVHPPVPMRRPYALEFTLPTRGPGALEVMDVAGRKVAQQDLGGLEPGRHSVALEVDRHLLPGIYWARLSSGPRFLITKLILIQ